MPRKSRTPTVADEIHEALLSKKVPPHIKTRRGRPSVIADAMKTSGDLNWNRAVCRETGQLVEHPDRGAGRIVANQCREQEALERALDVRERYGELLDRRDGPSKIASLEGVTQRTVRRWRTRLKESGQA